MRYTIDYLSEIVLLFENLGSCKLNDFNRLIELKRSFIAYSERIKRYHIFEIALDKSEINFLKNKKVSDFCHEYEKLQLLMRRHFTFEIMPNAILKPIKAINYFRSRFDFAFLKCERKLGKLTTTYGYYPENKAIIHKTDIVGDEIFAELIFEAKKNIEKYNNCKPGTQKRILKSEMTLVDNYFYNSLKNYKAIVEKYFFDYKGFFSLVQ